MVKVEKTYSEFLNRSKTLQPSVSSLSVSQPKESIKIFATTWNMAGKIPQPFEIDQLFKKNVVKHDMYVIGS
jgi:hypothetical protein